MPGTLDPVRDAVRSATTSRRAFLGMLGLGGLAVASPALLSACGSSADGSGSQELRWILGQSVPTLDIAKSAGGPIPLLALSHETLVRLDEDLSLAPVAARSWRQQSPTELVYTLRRGMRFWDGTPVTADDVVYSFERHLDPTVGSPIAALLANLVEVKAASESEVRITLGQPDQTARYLPALVTITPREYSERMGEDLGVSGPEVTTMGSGPYVITRFDATQGVEYEANPDHWAGAPRYQKVRVDFVADANARLLAVQGGDAEGTMDIPTLALQEWERVQAITVTSSPPLISAFLTLNVNRAPFDDVQVRRALAFALDRDGYVDAFLRGAGAASNAIPPPAQWANLASEETARDLYESLPSYRFDLDRARAELAASSHPDGFSASVTFPDAYPQLGKAMVSLAETLKGLNIDLSVQEAPAADWRTSLLDHRDAMNVMLLRPNYPDPADFLHHLLPSEAAAEGGFNVAEYRDSEIDRLMAQQAASDGDQRVTAIMELLQRMSTDLPYLPLWWEASSMALSDDYEYDDYSTLYYFQQWADKVEPRG